jgi:hypothetical protein
MPDRLTGPSMTMPADQTVACLSKFIRMLAARQRSDSPYSARSLAMLQIAVDAFQESRCECSDCSAIVSEAAKMTRPTHA